MGGGGIQVGAPLLGAPGGGGGKKGAWGLKVRLGLSFDVSVLLLWACN